MLPLTADRDVVLQHVSRLRSTFRGGTMANVGLQVGWWTLSPLWREVWNLGPPPPGQDTPLPLNYGALFMRKVVVLMTDGVNEWYDFPGGWPGACTSGQNTARRTLPWLATTNVPVLQPVACPSNAPNDNDADYTGYGRLRDGRLATTSPTQATTVLNNRMLELCEALKGAGIIIYTVTFNLDECEHPEPLPPVRHQPRLLLQQPDPGRFARWPSSRSVRSWPICAWCNSGGRRLSARRSGR